MKKAKKISKSDLPSLYEDPRKKLILRYLLSPESMTDKDITFDRTNLTGHAFEQRCVNTGEKEVIPYDWALKSVGYKSLPLQGVPF